MSYARFGPSSDVYVYGDIAGYVACCGCILSDQWDFHSAAEIVAHLREHVAAGHNVPENLLDESLYPDEDFVAECSIHLCRRDKGHGGEHTPIAGWPDADRHEAIRTKQLGGA
ncbi:hypothetical protein EDD28_2412 [Salana multivorans]|uniref:Uncharacterized protein n=1 Tax=Salana multivorans TaxID=120377 RepID=A0A3N2DDF2_9MICO|nr:hypothetical protein [Salana multivorans]ROR97803.1 hypothetical protein EDD28_2412 [Salana multivorans]